MRRSAPLALLAATAVAALAVSAPAAASGRPLDAELLGANEVGTAGDPDGSGTAAITVNPGRGEVCFEISVADIDDVVGGHIHEAPAGSNGGVVVNFMLTEADFTDGTATGCVDVERSLAKEIIQDSDEYYVNVHTSTFPAGALRGQL